MAIRDTVRRALRRSDDSDSSSQSDATTKTTSSQASEQSILQKTLSRTWTWGSHKEKERDPTKAERKAKKAKNKRQLMHPSEKPLTTQNLEHQEMLSHYTMTFGTRRLSQIEEFDFTGISPCCTRTPSVLGDGDADDEISPNMSPVGRRSMADCPN